MTVPGHPRISIDSAICGGRPCLAGTRVRVNDVKEMLADGAGLAEIVADFPYLTPLDVKAAMAFGPLGVQP